MINSVVLIGRVGADPDIKYFESGKVKTAFNIAVSRWASGGEKTDWFRVELWDKKAETAGEYVKKGALIAVDGKFDLNQWTDDEGALREKSVVRANNFRLLGKKKEEN